MANLNRVMLIGRLTRDPETRHTQGGGQVVNFGLAVNRSYRRKDSNDLVEETTFVDVEAWGKTGETFAKYVRKGRQVYVEGRLKLDQWEKEGRKHSKLSVVMENFQFLDSGRDGGGGGAPAQARRPAPAHAGAPGEAGSEGGGAAAPAGGPAGGSVPGAEETPQDDYTAFDDDIPF